jgi:Gpi18-like mannosyltransferase
MKILPPPPAVSIAAALVFYALFWPIEMQDMDLFLRPWMGHVIATGPVAVFAAPFANDTPPYLYLLAAVSTLHGLLPLGVLVKWLSVAGTVALAGALYRLLRTFDTPHAGRWAVLLVALPSPMLNAALLGQYDAMWAAPCLMALDAAIRRRHAPMLVWCGLAFAFKAQAMLFAPFVAAILINRRVHPALWLVAPAACCAAMLPALVIGWPASDIATIYLRQAGTFRELSLNAPNVWVVVQALLPQSAPALAGLAMTSAVGASACYVARFSARMPDGARMLPVALLATLVTAGLLPHMHACCFFLADVHALVWAIVSQERRAWHAALLIQAGSTLGLASHVFGTPWLVTIGFVGMGVATWLVAAPLVKPAANDNPLMMRTLRRAPLHGRPMM